MKSLLIFVLVALACYCTAEDDQVKDISPQNIGTVPNVMDGKASDTDVAANKEKDDVKAGDEKTDESPKSLDENYRIPEDPAVVRQSVSESNFKEIEMKDGKILKNRAGGEKTVVDGNGNKTTTKFGDSPSPQ